MKTCVQIIKGIPRFVIDGKVTAPMAYITYFTERNNYKDFAKAGYKLFSVPIFLGGRGINPNTEINAFTKGIYDEKDCPDYTILDEEINCILEVAPDAFIFPRVNVMLPEWWCLENPKECNDTQNRESFFSEKLREDAADMLRRVIAHIECSSYKEHIVGYQIAGGKTEEWFHFDNLGSRGLAAQKWMKKHYGDTYTEAQWCRANSEIISETIDFFAGIVKECTQNRLAVGCFYGYTLEVMDCYSGHHAMENLLQSKNIDFICAPASYMGKRTAGKDWPCMTALDSIKLHGKMFYTECDTRTHLTRPMREARPNGCKPGTYEGGLWKGPDTQQVTRWLLKKNAARQLTHGSGLWWFDMWGGWFAEPEMMSDLQKYREYAVQSLIDEEMEENQVAVLVDEQVYSVLPRNCETIRKCCYESREALGLAGVPYAIYHMGDFESILSRYKAFIFLAPGMTERMKAAIRYCDQNKIPFLVVDENKEPLETETLRSFYRDSGVHIWCESDDVLYAGNGWLSIHAATAGKKKILLPKGYSVLNEKNAVEDMQGVAREGDFLFVDMEQFETRVFRLSMLLLGIDGGGTKTVFKLTDQNGSLVRECVRGCSNPNDIGMEQTKVVLTEGICEVTKGISKNQIMMFAGLSGGGLTGNNRTVLNEFFQTFDFARFENGSDVENLIGLMDCEKAVLVIMGTGFVVYAINGNERTQIAGWGQYFDEGGSGYSIGRDGIMAALNALDGSGEKNCLPELLQEQLGESVQQHLAEFYRGGKRYIAGFAKMVFAAAEAGDNTSQKILEKNMDFTAQKIRTAIQQLKKEGDEQIPVLFAGGICKQWAVLLPMLERRLDTVPCYLQRLEQEPVEGALKLARRL